MMDFSVSVITKVPYTLLNKDQLVVSSDYCQVELAGDTPTYIVIGDKEIPILYVGATEQVDVRPMYECLDGSGYVLLDPNEFNPRTGKRIPL